MQPNYLTLKPKQTPNGFLKKKQFSNIYYYKQTPKGFSKAAADRLK